MPYLVLAAVPWALAVRAAPAPQALDNAIAPIIEGPDGIFSNTGEHWHGYKYVTCGELRFCRTNGCDRKTADLERPPVAEGLTTGLTTAVTGSQGTAAADDLDTTGASGQDSVPAVATSLSASESTVMTAIDSDTTASSSSGTTHMRQAIQTTNTASIISSSTSTGDTTVSASTSAQVTSETGTGSGAGNDAACVDDRLNEHVKLTKSPDGKWEMKGPKCSDGALMPKAEQLNGVTHLVLSFAGSHIASTSSIEWTPQNSTTSNPFNQTDFLKTLKGIEGVDLDMKVLATFRGWNLDAGFSKAGNSNLAEQIDKFKNDNNLFVDSLSVTSTSDMQRWHGYREYPVGGGEFHKACAATTDDHKLPERPYERDAFVDLLKHIRAADPDGHLSVAVSGKEVIRELSFPKKTIEEMDLCLDEWSLMTYDMMNRRDDKTLHHAGSAVIEDVLDHYHSNGVTDKTKINIGFAHYARYFALSNPPSEKCTSKGGLACEKFPAEGPAGQDLGTSGAWAFNQDQNPLTSSNVVTDYTLKLAKQSWDSIPTDETETHDEVAVASSWADVDNRIFWTWTTPKEIEQSCADHMKDAGGVMVWSIHQDVSGVSVGPHMEAIATCVRGSSGGDGGSSDDQ